MNKSNINEQSAGTTVDNDSAAQNHSVTQPNANTNVVGSLFSQREIKFRAWDGEKMHEGIVPWHWDFVISLSWHKCEKSTGNGILGSGGKTAEMLVPAIRYEKIMQYTGLKDKNGKEIYEGDIFKGREQTTLGHPLKEGLFACVWEDSGFIAKQIDGKSCDCWLYFFETNIQSRPLTECEIVGNIFENPELLHSVA